MSKKAKADATDPVRQRLRRFLARVRRGDARTRTLHLLIPRGVRVGPTFDRFLADARTTGTRVLDARCRSLLAPPFSLVRDWLEAAERRPDPLFELLGDRDVADHTAEDRIDPPWNETLIAFAELVRRALRDIAGDEPLLLVARDVHLADEDTRALLAHLAGRLGLPAGRAALGERVRMGLLVTFSEEATLDEGPAPLGVERFEVPLPTRARLAEAVVNEENQRNLLTLAGGDPLRLRAVLRALAMEPGSVTALIFERLGEVERRVLAALALLERPARSEELRAALGLSPARLADATSRLTAMDAARQRRERVELGALFEPAEIMARISPAARVGLHHALAKALAGIEAEPFTQVARDEEVARHLLHAGAVERGLPLALDAARGLAESGAPRRAADLLALVEERAPEEACQSGVASVMAEVLERLGALDEAEAARRGLLEAATSDSEKVLAALRLGALLLRRGDAVRATAVLEEARAAAPADAPDLRARLGVLLAEAQLRRGDAASAEHGARAAQAEARRQFLTATSLAAGQVLGKALAARGRRDEATDVFRRMRKDADAHGRVRDSARASYNLGVLALHRGAIAEARRCLERCLDASERGGMLLGVGLALTNLAVVHAHAHRMGEAIMAMQQAVAVFEDLGQERRLAVALADLSGLLVHVGDNRAAARAVARARSLAEASGRKRLVAHCLLREAEVSLEAGRGARAERALRVVEPLFAEEGATLDLAWALLGLARVAVERRDTGTALAHLESIETLPPEELSELRGMAALMRGRLLVAEGQDEAALLALEEAVGGLGSAGRPVSLAEALSRKAEVLARHGEEQQALALHQEARAYLEETASALPEPLRRSFRARRPVALVLAAARRAEKTAKGAPESAATEADLPLAEVAAPGGALPVPDEWRSRFPEILGESRPLRRVLQMVDRFAPVDATVLLLGESGTGKELVARALYRHSDRKSGPFVRINAAALTETLLLSELFGHERGAFTGAEQRVKGAFERAHGGTLFLDEIGDVSPAAQVSLLRVLQEREILRVGGTRPVPIDVRVICATNRDLEQLVADGRFRLDLYHRIRGLNIRIPPLRDRPDDIAPIAAAVLAEISEELGHQVRLAEEALTLLRSQPWQGNVRELQNVLNSVAVLTDGTVLRARDFVQHASLAPAAGPAGGFDINARPAGELAAVLPDLDEDFSLDDAKRQLEVLCIKRALARTGGNITHAARLLGMKRPRLSQKIKELGIIVPR